MPESRDEEHHVSTELPDSNNTAEPSNAIVDRTEMSERSDHPQALVIFVLGEHRFSNSCELGVMNEHPEALQAITSNQCLSTSAFLKPALHAAMAELRPSMMMQVAVRLTAITLRLAAKILQPQDTTTQDPDVCGTEHHKLSETICGELERAVPYYQWQGPRNYYGRVQYLMALLQEHVKRDEDTPEPASLTRFRCDANPFRWHHDDLQLLRYFQVSVSVCAEFGPCA